MFDEKTILEKRAAAWDGMKAIIETVAAEKRDITDDERTEYDNRTGELKDLDADLERVRAYKTRDANRTEVAETRGVSRDELDSAEKRYEQAFVNWFKRGDRGLSGEQRAALDANSLTTAPGAPAAGATGYDGGYMVPQGFWHNLQIAIKAYGGLLSHARVLQTDSGNPMPWPTIDPTAVQGYYVTEANQVTPSGLGFGGGTSSTSANVNVDYQFGQGMLSAWTIASGVVLASVQLLEDSAFDVDQFVSDRIGESIGRKVAQELHTGTGTSALLGVQTALAAKASSGVGLGGVFQQGTGSVYLLGSGTAPVAKTAARAVVGFDDLQNMITYVDPAYRQMGRCCWVLNDVTLAQLKLVTDNFGHPLWQPNVQVGGIDAILGYPVQIDQNAGNIPTAINTVGGLLFGDFATAMVVRQVNGAHTMRLTERYAEYLQVGYLGYIRMDQRSNDLRAAVAFKSAAA